MNKQIMGITMALMFVGIALAPPVEGTGSINFQIKIVKDATITLSELRITGEGALNFEPGINLLNDTTYALPRNDNSTEGLGHWTVTNIGNIDSIIRIRLNQGLPDGVISEVGKTKAYTYGDGMTGDSNYTPISTTIADYGTNPNLEKGHSFQFWQRMAADNTATGMEEAQTGWQVIITSIPQ